MNDKHGTPDTPLLDAGSPMPTDRSDDEAALWRIFFEQNRDGIVMLREDGSVYCANNRFASMLGYTTDEVERLHLWEWDCQYERSVLMEMLKSVKPCGDFFETRHRRKDGSEFTVEVTTNAAYYHGAKLIFCNCRDITERKRDQERIRRPMAVVMYDLDHFKRVNDTYGHQVGDEVLKVTAGLINATIRQVDIHARWGGEEFMVLLPEADLAEGLASAERLRQAIERHRFDHRGPVTASFGVAALGPRDTIGALLKRADDALYQAKHAGRNRVEAMPARNAPAP
ncbi:sensor domain-containing diguanylate cyclase [uncultured Halomonas sp.]|uniref:sensor domain-containing diguanylate cyclase n=1 Tax=uncultured Halomonas sp. TaxID=173971 RepID=UPI00260D902A|nr:sensor domain-containing diguanylate cyclase [uncultured Halomonas sp.]